MMSNIQRIRSTLRYLTCGLMAAAPVHAAQIVPSNQPLFLNQSVAPNILVTLDDSGSMQSGYTPDSHSDKNKVYFKSRTYNGSYYDPTVTYQVPKKVTFEQGNLIITDYPTPSLTNAWKNGFLQQDALSLASNYRATRAYDYYRNVNDESNVSEYYYDFTCSTATDANILNEKCYKAGKLTSDAQKTNFAIWYSYYRTRELATQSAASLAFYRLPETLRLSWQSLNSACNRIGSGTVTGNCYSNALRTFSGQHKANFYSFLANFSASGGTPLKRALTRAGDLLKDTTVNGPYAENPGTSIGTEYACRPTYHILMTDGVWNENNGSNELRDYDSDVKGIALPDRKTYSPRMPFSDRPSGSYQNNRSLADLALYYWATDARSLDNKIKPYIPFKNSSDPTAEYFDARNDPATWQHLTNYTIGLGLSGSLDDDPKWAGSTYAGGYEKLVAGTASWPNVSSLSESNVYDLWHAAINSRGEFFAADSPDTLAGAFQTILSRIGDRQTSAAAVAVESSRISQDNEAYFVRFSTEDWSGQLVKNQIDNATQEPTMVWDARDLLTGTGRNITFARQGALSKLQWSALSDTQKALLNVGDDGKADTLGQVRLAYILGDRSNEGTDSDQFRERRYLLGDIINSSPAVVGAAESPLVLAVEQDRLSGALANTAVQRYSEFVATQSARAKRIYVGANDGMLHGFDDNGIERFAFVPSAVFANLHWLPSQRYKGTMHRYFVDGTPVTSEILIDNKWRTILVGTLRGGGTALFALDVTEPGKEKLLWEFSDQDDSDLGYLFGQPSVIRLHDGNWGVVFGNGYGSKNDRAALFVLNAVNGTVISKLIPPAGVGVNGLSTVRPVDLNGDLITEYLYAGDLLGNLWRFDLFGKNQTSFAVIGSDGKLTTSASGDWRVAFGGKPLYRAMVRNINGQDVAQPIMAAPSLVQHPLQRGYIINFGTGRYVTDGDATPDKTRSMSLYGIWDNQLDPAKGVSTSTPVLSRANLVGQSLTVSATATFTDSDGGGTTREYRMLSSNPVNWYSADGTSVAKYGWYLDLKNGDSLEGEMLAFDMVTRARVLLASTLVPNSDPCEPGVSGWLLALDATTGGAFSYDVLDLTRNRQINLADGFNKRPVSMIRLAGFGPPTVVGDRIWLNDPDKLRSPEMFYSGPDATGRQNWRLIDEEDSEQ